MHYDFLINLAKNLKEVGNNWRMKEVKNERMKKDKKRQRIQVSKNTTPSL